MKKKLAGLVKDRGALLDKIDALLNLAETEHRDLKPEEKTEHDQHTAAIVALDAQIKTTRQQIEARDAQAALEVETRDGAGEPRARSLVPLTDHSVQGEVSDKEIRDLQKWRFGRILRLRLAGKQLDGIEGEMHEEGVNEAREAGASLEGNTCISLKAMQLAGDPFLSLQRRALTATGSTSTTGDQGGVAIQTSVGSIIERFYAKLLVKQMGTTVMDGLVGNVLFPRHIPDDEAVVTGENATAPVSSSTMGSLTLQPRRVPVLLEISRQLAMQTSPAVENYFREDLSYQIAKVIDALCINGNGGADQPLGILNMNGITQLYAGSTVSYSGGVPSFSVANQGTNAAGATLSYADVILMERALQIANADAGKLGFLTNPRVRALARVTPKVAVTGSNPYPQFVWEGSADSEVLDGYRAGVTTQMPSNLTKGSAGTNLSSIIFGNWADALMGQWGGMDLLINPYTKDDKGIVRVNAWSFFDFNIRRVLSFCAILDAVAY